MIYLDSSVALAYLLAEDRYPPKALWHQPIVSSRLLECEVWNRINARRLQDSHGDAVRGLIGRIAIIEMVLPVLRRALEPVSHSRSHAGCHSPGGHRVHPFPRSKRAAFQLRRTADRGRTSARNY